ncbi:hypothetical protein GZL_01231 [Streptomyces sp. 769]|nr:hypothetical protein GZL_01231 [Streptomyces sp. 769]
MGSTHRSASLCAVSGGMRQPPVRAVALHTAGAVRPRTDPGLPGMGM